MISSINFNIKALQKLLFSFFLFPLSSLGYIQLLHSPLPFRVNILRLCIHKNWFPALPPFERVLTTPAKHLTDDFPKQETIKTLILWLCPSGIPIFLILPTLGNYNSIHSIRSIVLQASFTPIPTINNLPPLIATMERLQHAIKMLIRRGHTQSEGTATQFRSYDIILLWPSPPLPLPLLNYQSEVVEFTLNSR